MIFASHYRRVFALGLAFLLGSTCAAASEKGLQMPFVPNTFVAGTPARAAEVNENFQTLVTLLEQQANVISSLQGRLNEAEGALAALQSNSVLELDGNLTLETDANGLLVARFNRVNVQITNGLDATNGDPGGFETDPGIVNGLGNLIVGYNEASDFSPEVCSDGEINIDVMGMTQQAACEAGGGVWAANQRTGSHNVILGVGNTYTNYGAIVGGFYNASTNVRASVINSEESLASGNGALVLGGSVAGATGSGSVAVGGAGALASGPNSAVVGGNNVEASGNRAAVLGGDRNIASGIDSAAVGGVTNEASAAGTVVSGGRDNLASGLRSTVSGGTKNKALGTDTSVSGGANRDASGDEDWVAGSLTEDN